MKYDKEVILERVCAYCDDVIGYILIHNNTLINPDYNPLCNPRAEIKQSHGIDLKCEPEVYKENGMELEYKVILQNRENKWLSKR